MDTTQEQHNELNLIKERGLSNNRDNRTKINIDDLLKQMIDADKNEVIDNE